jgi:GGDEF domain-containing protein
MVANPLDRCQNDDPRKLRELLQKASKLASGHALSCVMVGMSAAEGDLLFPEMVDYVGSCLRVDDAVFRMTRERAVCFLADADRSQAQEIMDRLLAGFHERFAPAKDPNIALSYYEVTPRTRDVSVRDLLPALFTPTNLAL